MAELDYAFVADHAQVADGKLYAMGASFTHVTVPSTDGMFIMSVAGRVRMLVEEPGPEIGVRLRAPDGLFEVASSQLLAAGLNAKPYDGKLGVLFAAGIATPIVLGLYEVFVSLDGQDVRRLAFEISLAS